MARVAAGLAMTLVEETRRLPTTAVTLPMTSVSLLLQTTMRLQQSITGLAIKGDEALSFMYPAKEQPEWAVFDEDQAATESDATGAKDSGGIGRFALYSTPLAAVEATAETNGDAPKVSTSDVVEQLGYDSLTLAQLRPRLRSLSTDELSELLGHERAGAARPPYLTMLENRIANAPGK